jgi:hypothetical protein
VACALPSTDTRREARGGGEPRTVPAALQQAVRSGPTRLVRLAVRLCVGTRTPVVALAALLTVLPAGASDARDHERARAAVQAGEVLPLPVLLERLQRTHPGQVLELELEREHGRWIYEVKLLQPGGQLLKLELDAGTGQVLEARRRKAERPDRAEKAEKPASAKEPPR